MKMIYKIMSVIIAFSLIGTALPVLGLRADEFTEVAAIDISFDKTYTGMVICEESFGAIDVSSYRNLYLKLSVYISENDNPSSIGKIMDGGEGQIELTSSGGCDNQELRWNANMLGLKAGWNELLLSFDKAEQTLFSGEAFNPAGINFFRMYLFAGDSNVYYTIKIKDISIVSRNSSFDLSSIYGDGMLFQQNKPFTVSGVGDAGTSVEAVLLDGNTAIASETVKVSADCRWSATFPAMVGGFKEYDIVFRVNGAEDRKLCDIVFGELWLATGQSNMEFELQKVPGAAAELSNPNEEYVRIFYSPGNPSCGGYSGNVPYDEQSEIPGGVWGKGNNREILKKVSAVAYYFAKKLRNELNVPVGVLSVAQGATSIYGWLSRSVIENNSEVKAYLQESGRYKDASDWNKKGSDNFYQMTAMYNQKISPLTVFAIKGLIWYQGEAEVADKSGTYSRALGLLRESYSDAFRFTDSSMPMIFAHIAPQFYSKDYIDKTAYMANEFNAVWQANKSVTAQIPVYDIPLDYKFTDYVIGVTDGEGAIHPMTKEPVGLRMANAALGLVYKLRDEYTSPVLSSATADGASLLLKFEHVGEGLAAKGNDGNISALRDEAVPEGFAICGADGIYLPAKAEIISNDTVRVSNSSVKYPIAATYAFTQMNYTGNLVSTFNGGELFAAVPFCSLRIDEEQFYHPCEWLSTERLKQWHSDGANADYYDVWRSGVMASGVENVSLSSGYKTDGAYSLKIDYKVNSKHQFGLSPNLYKEFTNWNNFVTFSDIDLSMGRYDSLSFEIKCGQAAEKGMRLAARVYTSGKSWALLPCKASSDSSAENNITLPATEEWQTVTVDLSGIDGILALEFLFSPVDCDDDFSGTIYLDNFKLGFADNKAEIDKQSLLNYSNTAREKSLQLYTATTRKQLSNALNNADNALKSAQYSQEAVNTYTARLCEALEQLCLIGDCNRDGRVAVDDMVIIRKILLGADEYVCEAADMDESSNVDIIDMVRIKKVLAHVIA